MSKSGIDGILDRINARSNDNAAGVNARNADQPVSPTKDTKTSGYSVGSMLDRIRDRDDEKVYSRSVVAEPATVAVEKKGRGMSLTNLADTIRDRDDDKNGTYGY